MQFGFMKYLKLFEAFKEYTLKDFLKYKNITNKHIKRLFCNNAKLLSLDGIENLKKLEELQCWDNQLTSLKGVENLNNLNWLNCHHNQIESLEPIKNLIKLKAIFCNNNNLNSLSDIENLVNLEALHCNSNQLTSLKGVENLTKLEEMICENNPLEYPIFLENCYIQYDNKQKKYFKSIEGQRNILTKYPERYADLEKSFGVLPEIKKEFPHLARGSEWGFFDLERSER